MSVVTPHRLDLDLRPEQIARLTSVDAITSFLHDLGYPTAKRRALAPSGLGLGETERVVTQAEVVSEDDDGFLRVVFVRLKSVTARARADLARAFGRDAVADHMLILASDFEALEFVLIDKEQKQRGGARREVATVARPRVFVVPRRWPHQSLRILRRLTYTMDDGLRQFDKLRSVFDAAHFSGTYFTNRALFADHFLETRLKENAAWRSDPGPAFQSARRLMDAAPDRIGGKPVAIAKQELYDPLWSILGFRAAPAPRDGTISADYTLRDGAGEVRTVALVYPWQRWLDGPDPNDPDRPAENPGAAVVTLLERGDAPWVIVTNGTLWRIYSRAAHSRSTNFYEVDLQDALVNSGLTDPNEAFRYWWLFFRLEAFSPADGAPGKVWLDLIAEGSRDYAREVEAELKRRVFYDVVPMLAQGFLHDRRTRLKKVAKPTEQELEEIRSGTLTLLYRILFLFYAESRDLLPVREAAYYQISLKRLKEEVRAVAGVSQSEADTKVEEHFSKLKTDLFDRLGDAKAGLFAAMANGRPAANVPRYNGGLFRMDPSEAADEREATVAEFLNNHKVPDYFLAAAIDRLARVEDPRTFSLEFVDYKSLGVRQLGSIYEGLLEFKLHVADEDLAVAEQRGRLGDYIPLAKARGKAAKRVIRQIKKGEPILQRDNAERKATGSYYTPDHIVQYIVEHAVGPVLKRKVEALRPEFRSAEQTYHAALANAESDSRIMLGWRPEWGGPLAGEPGKPTRRDRERFALEKTYRQHQALVERLFDLKVLDPAMGSGHFLVEAVDFITDELLDFLNAFPVNPVSAALERTREAILASLREQGIEVDEYLRRQLTDVHLLKRHVLKRCIYGVDLNPLATELAKVSLWLDAFTLGAPLSFLDHHLRPGNSLIGSSVKELHEALIDKTAQHTTLMFGIDHDAVIARAVQNVLQIARWSDATASEVADSKRKFDESRAALAGYRFLLDILVARHFGHKDAMGIIQMGRDIDLSHGRDAVIKALNAADRRRLADVDQVATERRFFHWDLEFPEIFYRFAGIAEGRIERREPGDAGFDVIIGNPPYLGVRTGSLDEVFAGVARQLFNTAGRNWDLFALFVERGLGLLTRAGALGYIIPSRAGTNRDFAGLRSALFDAAGPTHFLDCGAAFDDPSVLASILLVQSSSTKATISLGRLDQHGTHDVREVERSVLSGLPDSPLITSLNPAQLAIFRRIGSSPKRLTDYVTITRGMECGKNDPNVMTSAARNLVPVLSGEGVEPYRIKPQGMFIRLGLEPRATYKDPALFTTVPKLLVRFVAPHPIAAPDTTGFGNFNTVYNLLPMNGTVASLNALLCLLNSSVVRWWFRVAFNADEALFPHIQKYQLEAIPLPDLDARPELRTALVCMAHEVMSGARPVDDPDIDRLCATAFGLEPNECKLLS